MSLRLPSLLAGAVLALSLGYAAAALTVFPTLFPDPAYGLLVDKSRRAGAPFNHVTEPRLDDIARDETYFHTMWSPGQHAIPGALVAAGATLGGALQIVNLLAALAGLAGWYWLFHAMRFEPVVALGACLVIAASRTYGFSFLAYVGSDQLAFAAFPYLARSVLAVRDRWSLTWVAPLAVMAGFFLKNSMAVYVTAWVLAVLAGTIVQQQSRPTWMRLGGVALAVGAALRLIDWAYVSRGWTPMTYHSSWSTNLATYLLPAAMPLLTGTGIDDLLSRAFDHPDSPKVDYKGSLLLLVPVAGGAVAWALAECRHPLNRVVRVTIVAFVTLTVAVFTYFLATGSGASVYLSRHYVIPGALLLPLLLERLFAVRSRVVAAVLVLVLALPGVYGVLSFAANWRRHYVNRAAHSQEVRIAHLSLTPRVVQHLRRLDRELPEPDSLVVVPNPSLAFEFSRVRVMATSATSDGIPEFRKVVKRGRVRTLVVIADEAGQTPVEIDAWLTSFLDYDPANWRRASIDGFSFYVPGGQPIDEAWLARTLEGATAGR